MDGYIADLKTDCFQLPHWQMLLLQAFHYGVLNWFIPVLEEGKKPVKGDFLLEDLVAHSDPEFRNWPSDWLNSWLEKLFLLDLSHEQLYLFSEQLEEAFRDCIPTDLDIYGTFLQGETLTDEQWTRLYTSVAFQPPTLLSTPSQKGKTRRMHGRRAITPIKRRRAITYHKSHKPQKTPIVQKPHLQIVKLQ